MSSENKNKKSKLLLLACVAIINKTVIEYANRSFALLYIYSEFLNILHMLHTVMILTDRALPKGAPDYMRTL